MRSRLLRYVGLLDKAQTGLTHALAPGTAYALLIFSLAVFILFCRQLIVISPCASPRDFSHAHRIHGASVASPAAREGTTPDRAPSVAETDGNSYIDLQQATVATQLHLKFSKLPRIEQIRADSNIFLTFSNGHYANLMLNAASLVADLGYPVVVLVFDQDAATACEEHNLPYIWSAARMDTADFRSEFLHMGAQKPLAVLRLFEEVNARTVVLMDTDTIWLRDPFPWLDQHSQADLYVTTDCLSHHIEVLKVLDMARCGHVPGSTGPGWAMNTGITIWRNSPGARSFAQAWHDLMVAEERENTRRDDQMTFNVLMMSEQDAATGTLRRKHFPLARVEGDDRVFFSAPGDAVRLMVLPSVLFAGGKTMFYSHLPAVYGLHPYVVHATFQRYNNNGKVARFREAGAYVLDEPEYFNDGDFLVYDNLVLEYISALETLASGTFTLVHKHLLAGAYQLATLRDGAAMAKALGRILVLPKVWAWCDSDSMLTIMRNCTFDGSEHYPPWQAPGDLFFNMDAMEASADFMPWRHFNFLTHPRTPRSLTWSETSIWYHFPDEAIPVSYGTGPHVQQMGGSGLRAATADVHARVLRVQNLQPGTFSGFVEETDNQSFNRWFDRMMYDMKWCCSTQIPEFKERHWDSLFFAAPAPLSSTTAPRYQVPLLQRPGYCEEEGAMRQLREEGPQPLSYPLHPCNFLEQPPTLPDWGPPLWSVLRDMRTANTRATYMAGVHRAPL